LFHAPGGGIGRSWLSRRVGATLAGQIPQKPMKLRRLFSLILIPFLLFVQQAAPAHAVTHLGKEPPPQERLAHTKLCDLCVGLDNLGHAATASAPVLICLPLSFPQPVALEYVFQRRTVAVFLSRAPPDFS
jgi:hypothetical protein